jgi:hypothetical protein
VASVRAERHIVLPYVIARAITTSAVDTSVEAAKYSAILRRTHRSAPYVRPVLVGATEIVYPNT